MYLRRANSNELERVLGLYRAVTGGDFCVWNDSYPGMEEIQGDYAAGSLYVMLDEERIIGAVSIVPENELDALPFWKSSDGSEREIARVAVDKTAQGRGVAADMAERVCALLKEGGCSHVRLSAATVNIPAIRAYLKVGFEIVGEADMYNNGTYYLMEKPL